MCTEEDLEIINDIVELAKDTPRFRKQLGVTLRKTLLPWERTSSAVEGLMVRRNLIGEVVAAYKPGCTLSLANGEESLREKGYVLL